MADGTHIEWTDATWNPITGCSVVSAGCKHCYAMKLAGTRLQHHPSRAGLTVDTKAGPVWNGEVRLNADWLDQPMKWKRPRRIFVCAHGDLFHESVPDDWIDRVFAVMALCPQHTFQVLTKRAERMRDYLSDYATIGRVGALVTQAVQGVGVVEAEYISDGFPGLRLSNVWLGVSAENQDAANERIPLLLQTPAAVRWVSAEPLLGAVDLRWFLRANVWENGVPVRGADYGHGTRLDWVVAGGESGTGARPMHPDWARSLRYQCKIARVPFLFKQWGLWGIDDGSRRDRLFVYRNGTTDLPDDRLPEYKNGGELEMAPMGKKLSGRILDGRTWDGYPREGT